MTYSQSWILTIGLNMKIQKHGPGNRTAEQTLLNLLLAAKTKQTQTDSAIWLAELFKLYKMDHHQYSKNLDKMSDPFQINAITNKTINKANVELNNLSHCQKLGLFL